MNVQEFAALKPGDKIGNPLTWSTGRVSRVVETGIWLVWLVPGEPDSDANARFYGVQSTIWFHWDVVPAGEPNALELGAASTASGNCDMKEPDSKDKREL